MNSYYVVSVFFYDNKPIVNGNELDGDVSYFESFEDAFAKFQEFHYSDTCEVVLYKLFKNKN